MSIIKNNLQYFMLVSIVAGLGNVYFTGGMTIGKNILVFIVITFVIYPVMIDTKFEEIFAHFKEPRPIFCSLALNFLFSPLIGLILARIFFKDHPTFFIALLLLSIIPTSSMSVAWTAFSGARIATALYLIPLNIIFAAFIGLPFLFPFLLGDISLPNQEGMIKNVMIVFFVPLVIGDITRRILIRWKGTNYFNDRIKPNLGGISSIGVIVLIFLIMSLKRNTILLDNTSLVLWIVVPVFLYYFFLYIVSYIWTKFLIFQNGMAGAKAVVIIYTTVARHINISIAIALSTFPLEMSGQMILFLIVAYIVQVPSLAFFSQRFGKDLSSIKG